LDWRNAILQEKMGAKLGKQSYITIQEEWIREDIRKMHCSCLHST
jgi:hypothetical protein